MAPTAPDTGPTAWRPVRTGDGSWTLAHPEHGETCHSREGAWSESLGRYAGPCRLRELGLELAGSRPLRLLDLGTGAGWNLAAAQASLEGTGTRLEVETFEHSLGVLRAALELPAEPAAARRAVEWARAGIAAGLGDSAAGAAATGIRLHVGDALETLPRLPPEAGFDAVFLDPFSPGKEEGGLWSEALLAEVAARMRPRAILSSFTSAYRVRLALYRAGLEVGVGPEVGLKRSGTLASHAWPLDPVKRSVAARLVAEGPRGVAALVPGGRNRARGGGMRQDLA